jgi:3',5'-cyclic AMP phosphodiesterase CpdA
VSLPRLLAVSDLHVRHRENRTIVEELRPGTADDWLIVAGDVAEQTGYLTWALGLLRERFAKVIWVPGNHELWTPKDDPVQLRGVARYEHLVEMCRRLDVVTPEDDYPIWPGEGGPAVIAPLFLLYDYTFLPPGTDTAEAALELAYQTGIVCTDEQLLHPDPFPSRAAWCHARLEYSRARLDAIDPRLPTVLINHWPMTRQPTEILRYPQFAQWCGTTHTRDWHIRYRSSAVVYGHLHIPRSTVEDGVRFEEVSLGYPREWRPRKHGTPWPRQILPAIA